MGLETVFERETGKRRGGEGKVRRKAITKGERYERGRNLGRVVRVTMVLIYLMVY